MAKKLPQTIYVKRESDRDAEWLSAFDSCEDGVVNVGDVETVGVYELKERIVLKGVVKKIMTRK